MRLLAETGVFGYFRPLMDLMDDDEPMAVIGHEIGHVVHTDSKDAMKNAYLAAAAKSAAGAAGGVLGKIDRFTTGGDCPSLVECSIFTKTRNWKPMNGFEFCIKHGFDPYGMANALEKLNNLSEDKRHLNFSRCFLVIPIVPNGRPG